MHSRNQILAGLCVAVILSIGAIAQEPQDDQKSPLEKTAESIVTLLKQGQFEQVAKSFNARMLEALPPDKLKKAWGDVVGQAGDFIKQIGIRTEHADDFDTVVITCEFANAKVDAKVVFDEEEKITGLFFTPAKPTGEEEIWEGTLDAGVAQLKLVFHLFKQKDGSYAATMDSPDQDSMGIVLDEATAKDGVVRFEHKRAGFSFEGKLSESGKELSGEFSQAGQTFQLELKKVEKSASADPKAPSKKPIAPKKSPTP